MSNSGSTTTGVAAAFIVYIIAAALFIVVFRFSHNRTQQRTNQIAEPNLIITIDVAEALKNSTTKTFQLPTTGYIFDFTRQNATINSIGRVQITTGNKIVVLNGSGFENGIPINYINNDNVLKAIPLGNNVSITLTKPLNSSNNIPTKQVAQPPSTYQNHSQESAPAIIISGEFKAMSGDCTPYCLITITGNSMLLEGTHQSGSIVADYKETYIRTSSDLNSFHGEYNANGIIKIINTNEFRFSNSVIGRTCTFIKTMDR